MPIPDFQSCMLPILQGFADGEIHHGRDSVEFVVNHFGLTDADRKVMLSSGKQSIVANRANWAKFHLGKAGLVTSPKRGHWQISVAGRELLKNPPEQIDIKFLMEQYEDFATWHTACIKKAKDSRGLPPTEAATEEESITPLEAIDNAHKTIRESLKSELLQMVMDNSPEVFEQLVIDLLEKMGYGGSHGQAQAVGRSGDGGIDGVIMEDRLGLDVFYVQAKRWNPSQTVGRPEIQKFAGALHGQQAHRGIFITTARFSKDAQEYVDLIDTRIVLVDGNRLTNLMIDYDLGVSIVNAYEIKKIDTDYFEDE